MEAAKRTLPRSLVPCRSVPPVPQRMTRARSGPRRVLEKPGWELEPQKLLLRQRRHRPSAAPPPTTGCPISQICAGERTHTWAERLGRNPRSTLTPKNGWHESSTGEGGALPPITTPHPLPPGPLEEHGGTQTDAGILATSTRSRKTVGPRNRECTSAKGERRTTDGTLAFYIATPLPPSPPRPRPQPKLLISIRLQFIF